MRLSEPKGVTQTLERLEHRRGVAFLLGVFNEFNRDQCPFLAAAICYFVFFAIFPLLLGLLSLASFFVSPQVAERQIMQGIGTALPSQVSLLHTMLDSVMRSRGSIGIIAAVLLLWSARGAFMALGQALDIMWESAPLSRWQDLVKRNVIAALCAIGIGGGLIVTSLLYYGLAFASRVNVAALGVPGWLLPAVLLVTSNVLPVLIVAVGLFVAYRVLPCRRLPDRPLLIGALVASALWEVTRLLFGFYVDRFAHFSMVYGPISSLIAFLFWIYVTSMLFLLGAEVAGILVDGETGEHKTSERAPDASDRDSLPRAS